MMITFLATPFVRPGISLPAQTHRLVRRYATLSLCLSHIHDILDFPSLATALRLFLNPLDFSSLTATFVTTHIHSICITTPSLLLPFTPTHAD